MIYHITSLDYFEKSKYTGIYKSERFEAEGFIHCSERHQLEDVADTHFAGEKRLLVLELDPTCLTPETRYESFDRGNDKYPHVYGAIKIENIVRLIPISCNKDGLFRGIFKDI